MHAIDRQNYTSEFSQYLITQLGVPAARIEQVCGHIRALKPNS